jgi:hypothetical protein
MTSKNSFYTLVGEHKTLFIIVIVGLFLIELEIFAVAAIKSGRQSWLQVVDRQGHVIHETDGDNLSDFNKYYFEKTFGPLTDYQVKLMVRDTPFPFRAWFSAAIGLPIGMVLLFAFVIRAYAFLILGDRPKDTVGPDAPPAAQSRFEAVLNRVSRLNIFIIGFLVFMAVFAYWVIPNTISYAGRMGIDTLIRYKWFFLALAAVLIGFFIWIIYLRYLLARKTIESQTEVNKYRLALQYHGPAALNDDAGRAGRIGWDGDIRTVAGCGEVDRAGREYGEKRMPGT